MHVRCPSILLRAGQHVRMQHLDRRTLRHPSVSQGLGMHFYARRVMRRPTMHEQCDALGSHVHAPGIQFMKAPWLRSTAWPVKPRASADNIQRTVPATSCGSDMRPNGTADMAMRCASSRLTPIP